MDYVVLDRSSQALVDLLCSDLPTRRFESKLADLAEHVFALFGQLLHLWARVHFTGKTRPN